MRKNKEKETARTGIVLLMESVKKKMEETMNNGTKGMVGSFNPAAELNGYADVLSNLADILNKLS